MFLLDQNELVAKVFDGGVVDDEVSQGLEEGGCGRGPGGREYAVGAVEQARWLMVRSVTGHQLPLYAIPGPAEL